MTVHLKVRIVCLLMSSVCLSTLGMAQSPPLTLQSIQPNAVLAGSGATSITLPGSGFTSSTTIQLGMGGNYQTMLTPVLIDGQTLQLTIPANFLTMPAALMLRGLDGPSASDWQFLYVYSSAAPTVTSMNPSGGLPGTTTAITLTGTNLIGAAIMFGAGGITAVPDQQNSYSPPTEWILQVTIPADAAPDTQAITISTPSGSTTMCGARLCAFSVVQSGIWTDVSTTSLPSPSTFVKLLDGRVLVFGVTNNGNGAVSVAKIFDPATNQWTDTGAPNTPRRNSGGLLLLDGRIFVSGSDSSMAEIYDPATGAWSYTNPMTAAAGGYAVLLPSGMVLVGADLFDPVSGVFQSVPVPSGAMQLLGDGRVLILTDGNDMLYDPATGTISAAPNLPSPYFNTGYITRLLPDDRVLIQTGFQQTIHNTLGVFPYAAIYDPQMNTLLPSAITIGGGSRYGGAVVLSSGNVLVSEVVPTCAGPLCPPDSQLLSATLLYDPQTDRTFPQTTANPPFTPDILLDDGRAFGITEFNGIVAGVYTPAAYITPAPVIGSVRSMNGPTTGLAIIDVRGTSFLPNSLVQLGQSRLVTLYLGAQRLIAFVPGTLSSALTAGITITNPGPGGGSTAPTPVGFIQTLPIAEVETGTIRTGYAIITPDSGSAAPASTLTYGIVQNGIVESQAAILPNPLTTATTLPVDYVQTIGRNVGIAVANPGTASASITLTLRDTQGTAASSISLSIAASNQIARFVSELFPADALGAAFTGSLSVQSSQPVSIIGLRFSGQEFSTVPVFPVTNPPATSQIVFPQVAMSGGWATTFGLVNTTGNTISGRLDLFDPTGKPLVLTLNDTTASTFTYSIPARGSLTFAPRDPSGLSPF